MKPLIVSEEYYGIRILRDGTWLYQGSPIARKNMVKLFSTALQKDEKGAYWLVTPYEKGKIEVEDAPFTAVELKVETSGGVQTLLFRTNLDEWVEASAANPLRVEFNAETAEPSPYILVRKGLEARITRAVYYELAEIAVADPSGKGVYGLWSHNIFFAFGPSGLPAGMSCHE